MKCERMYIKVKNKIKAVNSNKFIYKRQGLLQRLVFFYFYVYNNKKTEEEDEKNYK